VRRVKTNYTIADASLLVGLAALALTTVLYVTRPSSPVTISREKGMTPIAF
jgi:hypothetical protein